jgi:hypothetical protein
LKFLGRHNTLSFCAQIKNPGRGTSFGRNYKGCSIVRVGPSGTSRTSNLPSVATTRAEIAD